MNLSDAGAKFIASHEGLVLETYDDPAGHCTVGIGHLIHKGNCTPADRTKWGRLTEEQAYELFRSDARRFIDAVARLVTVPVTQNQADALISLAYNIGEGNFGKSTLLKKLNAGDYQGAANEFPKWNKARDPKTDKLVVLKGLTRRRAEERALFLRSDPGGAATIQIPIAASQAIPRLPGESKEVAYLREYLKDSGVPHRITSTVRSELPSRHAQMGTDGEGLAIDAGGPKPGWDTEEMAAIFRAFEPVEHLLYELIYAGPQVSYNIKRGKRVAKYAVGDHHNHVHVSVNRGVFIEFPGASPQVGKEEDVIRIITTTNSDGTRAGVYLESNMTFVRWVPNPAVWDQAKRYAAEGLGDPVLVPRIEFDLLEKVGQAPKEAWPA